MRVALITGITGQDGSYLAELLLAEGYDVHGIMRRSSTFSTSRIDHIIDRIHLHYGDVTDAGCISRLVHQIEPDELYNLAAQSHVRVSFDQPAYTAEAVGMGALHVLEAVRTLPSCRVYQASSSEMYGQVDETPQSETTPFLPRSPYGCAKAFAHNLAVNYRESYGLHVSCGILFNHESPRRGETFVTRKIAAAAARISAGRQQRLYLGNLDARRDWGHAADYVRAMWLMLQQDQPDDYVIATGETHSVEEFLHLTFEQLGMDDWRPYVRQDPKFFRPAEVDLLIGDPTKAREKLGWKPEVGFRDLVAMMVEHDVAYESARLRR